MPWWWQKQTFSLIKDTPSWRREYFGPIEPFDQYRFRLVCDALTGRQGVVERPNKYVTHHIFGSYVTPEGMEFEVIDFYCERLSQAEAIQIQDEFRLWWIAALARYQDLRVLKGHGGILL
jgi:hypothetical protein